MFKVVPDQLRISEGWVRCGHCSEVFDARSHLQSENPLLQPAGSLPQEPQGTAFEGGSTPPAASLISGEAELPGLQGNDASFASSASISQDTEFPPNAPVSSGALLVHPESPLLSRQDEWDTDTRVVPSAVPPPKKVVPQEPVFPDEMDSVLDEDVSFVREARRRAFWHQPLLRTALAIFSFVLVCGLALQFAVHERDRLVAMEPKLKPWLVRLCMPLGCTVAVPRQIESVVIDSSTFNRVRGEVFRLSFTVKNTAAQDVATPAVELTLTDTQDQAVVRRVLLPAELGAELVLPPKGAWSAVLNMSVDSSSVPNRVSGYRLLAFYP
jgi:predicted Zn finger-like uncharacterized protein